MPVEAQRVFLPEVYDKIAEKFGPVVYTLTNTAFIYGGAVRDVLAGLPIEGDLDIVVGNSLMEVAALKNAISTIPEWRRDVGTSVVGYDMASMSMVIQYTHAISKNILQIIVTKNFSPKQLRYPTIVDCALYFVKTVDLTCCGVCVDSWGFLYEVCPGAVEDCLERIVRHNPERLAVNNERVSKRVSKLSKRGWLFSSKDIGHRNFFSNWDKILEP